MISQRTLLHDVNNVASGCICGHAVPESCTFPVSILSYTSPFLAGWSFSIVTVAFGVHINTIEVT